MTNWSSGYSFRNIIENNILSKFVFLRTYAKTLDGGRKETYDETVDRVCDMHCKKFPEHKKDITEAFKYVHDGKVLPSMRSMQFAGDAVEKSNSRIYNCQNTTIQSYKDIADIFFLLMNGCGVGYSVQQRHIRNIPPIKQGVLGNEKFVIEDNRESWSDSSIALMNNYDVDFDYSHIRKRGEPLSTGGTASGPEPLIEAHNNVRLILRKASGRRLTPAEVCDIVCYYSDSVVVGGVRRGALIALADSFDNEMMMYKNGNWREDLYSSNGLPGEFNSSEIQSPDIDSMLLKSGNPQRGRVNVSMVVHRKDKCLESKVTDIIQRCFISGNGEPGIFITNDYEVGINPCGEASLRDGQSCNLTEINIPAIENREDFSKAKRAAVIIGTLQAAYTDFRYISPKWKKNCEEDALLGVSLTGIAQNWSLVSDRKFLSSQAKEMVTDNVEWSKRIGINPAARIGAIKPSGNSSALLDVTSGIHGAHAKHYLRRGRIDKNHPVAKYLISVFGIHEPNTFNIVEYDKYNRGDIVVSVPTSKTESIMREQESAIDLLERSKYIHETWIRPSHVRGENTHNVSLTVSYKEHEKEHIINWILRNKDWFSGVTFLPQENITYDQAPFQKITETSYIDYLHRITEKDINMNNIDFKHIEDTRECEASCHGGKCEII